MIDEAEMLLETIGGYVASMMLMNMGLVLIGVLIGVGIWYRSYKR
jgi:hypothetical protein